MLHQTFSLLDIPRLLILIFLECALSAYNALIIAAIIKPLSLQQRTKALWCRVTSAILLRVLAIFGIAYFIHFFWIQILGAVYLLYLAVIYRVKDSVHIPKKMKTQHTFWKIVVQLECVDFIFAFDSIIAALGLTGLAISPGEGLPPKIWIVYLGGVIGLLLMRFAAKLFAILMDTCYHLEKASHYLIGCVAIKLGFEATYSHFATSSHKTATLSIDTIFWIGLVVILIFGFIPKKRRRG